MFGCDDAAVSGHAATKKRREAIENFILAGLGILRLLLRQVEGGKGFEDFCMVITLYPQSRRSATPGNRDTNMTAAAVELIVGANMTLQRVPPNHENATSKGPFKYSRHKHASRGADGDSITQSDRRIRSASYLTT